MPWKPWSILLRSEESEQDLLLPTTLSCLQNQGVEKPGILATTIIHRKQILAHSSDLGCQSYRLGKVLIWTVKWNPGMALTPEWCMDTLSYTSRTTLHLRHSTLFFFWQIFLFHNYPLQLFLKNSGNFPSVIFTLGKYWCLLMVWHHPWRATSICIFLKSSVCSLGISGRILGCA